MSEPQNHRSNSEMAIFAGIAFIIITIYLFGYSLFDSLGLTNGYVNRFLARASKSFSAGGSTDAFYKGFALFFAFQYALGSASKKYIDTKIMAKQVQVLITALCIFLFNLYLLRLFPLGSLLKSVLYSASTIISYIYATSSAIKIMTIRKQERLNMDDKFNNEGEQFDQVKNIIGDQYSVHIPAKGPNGERYYWNYVNPFAGNTIVGNPGTGKSFVHIEEFLRQLTLKGFTVCLYDYKNELTDILYKYIAMNHKAIASHPNFKGKKLPKFNVLNFDDPKKSVRINPLHPRTLNDLADCKDVATVFMHNINRSWIEKRGEFFSESAIAIVSSLITFLRYSAIERLADSKGLAHKDDLGNCCTLPHVISLLHCPRIELFTVLANHPSTKIVFAPFAGAINDGAMEQLSGQLATTQISLSAFATPKIYWALTGDDCTTFISDRENPQYLCLVNNEQRREVYGPALSMILGQVVKKINTPGNYPSLLCVDELATVYIKDIDNLIATARSKQVAVLLGFQDIAQMVKDYGKKVTDVVVNTIGNLAAGRVMRETAKDLQEVFGKMKMRKTSVSHSQTGSSVSESEQLEYVIPASKISTLGQGEFVLRLSDTMENPLPIKFAKGRADIKSLGNLRLEHPDNEIYRKITRPDMQKEDITQKMMDDNFARVQKEVMELLQQEIDVLGLREVVDNANAQD